MVGDQRTRRKPVPAGRGEEESAVGVLIVDDQAVFRDLARLVLRTTRGFTSVGEADSGEKALELIDELKPELVLVDVRMPGMGGIEAARQIRANHPEAIVVLISLEDPRDLASAAEDSGAIALVRKQDFGPAMLRDLWAKYGGI
jgi:two-component system, NarL family, invasion response regulator UvrY